MSQKDIMIENLLKEIDGYYMHLVYLKDLLSVEEDIEKHKDKMQLAPNFTLIVNCALIDGYMLALTKLYEKSDEVKTIPNLIKKCKANISLFESKNEVQKKLDEFEDKIANDEYIARAIDILKSRRDTSFVHNDSKYFGTKIQKDETYLPAFCIWRLRDFAEEVLDYITSQLTSKEQRKTKYNCDLKNLF